MSAKDCIACVLICFAATPARAVDTPMSAPLTSATTRELINVVRLRTSDKEGPAKIGDIVRGDDLLRTGSAGSMAQIEFDDHRAVTRLGSETLFTFSARTGRLSVSKGLTLISVREGTEVVCESCGGVLLASARSTAVVESFVVKGQAGKPERCATKFILLEGTGKFSTSQGKQIRTLRGGQMIVQVADDPTLAEVQDVDLKRLVRESRIVTGFKHPLPSMGKIQQVIDRQQRELWLGTLERTRFTIGGRGPERYQEPSSARTGLEAPFDSGIPDAIKAASPPCLVCP